MPERDPKMRHLNGIIWTERKEAKRRKNVGKWKSGTCFKKWDQLRPNLKRVFGKMRFRGQRLLHSGLKTESSWVQASKRRLREVSLEPGYLKTPKYEMRYIRKIWRSKCNTKFKHCMNAGSFQKWVAWFSNLAKISRRIFSSHFCCKWFIDGLKAIQAAAGYFFIRLS